MELTHKQIRQLVNILIGLIWVVGFVSLYLLGNPAYLSPTKQGMLAPVLPGAGTQKSVGFDVPDKSFENEKTNGDLRPVQNVQLTPQRETRRFEFSSKNSFLEYFDSQYPVNELLAQYDAAVLRAGSGSNPDKIVVEKVPVSKGNTFNENFKVSVRFSIKPVPK